MSAQPIQKKAWVYDLETFPNFFSGIFIHHKGDEERRFIIYNDLRDSSLSINQYKELIHFLRTEVKTLIGYNNQGYDDIMLKHLLITEQFFNTATVADITTSLKGLNDKIINGQSRDRRDPDQYIENLKSRKMFGSLDLMLLFNTINRVGLKQIGINLRWPEIIDLPHDPSHIVVSEEVDKIMYYNRNDVLITKRLLADREEVIKYRKEYTDEFNTNVINSNDTNIAKTVIRKNYCEVSGRPFESFREQRTFYKKLYLNACISPRITFMSKPFQEALNKFRNAIVDPNKAIKEINEEKKAKLVVNDDGTMSIDKIKEKKKQFEHILKTKRMTHTLGLGGIHSNNPSEILEETADYEYIDADVTSYYPSILIEEKLFPKHLGPELVTVYKDKLYYPRLAAKKEGKKALAEMLKIALNSSFGLTKSVHSWMYDPHVTLSITISGQLFLMMLIERLEYYTDCVVVYSNTDGITVRVPKSQKDEFYAICHQWSEYTRFGLEFVNFKRMVVRDVNNFLMVTYDTKKPIKCKGDFVNNYVDRPTPNWITQGYQFPVIAMALQEYYCKGISPEVFIKSQNDIYNFMKAERTSTAKYDIEFRSVANPDVKVSLNKNNRWIITKGNPEEGKLRKKSIVEFIKGKKNKRFGKYVEMQKDRYVTLLNDLSNPLSNISMYRLDYDFYIGEVYKIIKTIRTSKHEIKKSYEQMSLI